MTGRQLHGARRTLLPLLAAMLAACATPAPPQPPPPVTLTSATPEQMVAAIRTVAGSGEGEVAVQPLRDPQVEDLRQRALRLEQEKYYADAAKALDHALAIVPDDPALLQERAEAAILLKDYGQAETLARRAFELGPGVGPLCRRHWATVEQVRLVEGDAAGAASAKAQVAGCKVAGVDRF